MSNPVTKFEIHLEHDIDEQYQYEPGEVIRGQVALTCDEVIQVKSIVLQIKGEATVSWPSDEQAGDALSTSETYVDVNLAVFGSDRVDSECVKVAKGEHSYPFEYSLPLSLPSSFIGKYGGVTYVVKATLREYRPGGLGTMITSEPFLILRPVDLGSNPELKQKRMTVASKRTSGFSIFCCLFGKTVGRFSVNKTGVLPGQDIIIDADVSNDASQPIKSIQAALVLVSTFQARKLTRTHSQVLLKKADNVEVGYGASRKWTGVRLSVPSYIPQSRLEGCDMIDVEYELRFRLEMADGSEVPASIPMTVGTPKRKGVAVATDTAKRMSGKGSVKRSANGMLGMGDEGTERDIETDMEKFRHPMIPGETRKNILFEGNVMD